jgi:hypothetical protein
MSESEAEVLLQLKSQLQNPEHVYIEVFPGRIMRHGTKAEEGCEIPRFAGAPMRFTKLAAERFARDWPGAKLVEEMSL